MNSVFKFFKISLTILILFSGLNSFSQKTINYNQNGERISHKEFQKQWRNKDSLLSRWDYIDTKNRRIQTLKRDLYLKTVVNYNGIKLHLEKLTGKKLADSTNICIEYVFLDDLCSSRSSNKWNVSKISRRKLFLTQIKKELNSKNIYFICLFEEGITLKNRPKNKGEYFYSDKNNFFRNLLFKSPTLCGSFALIKHNGQTLIRNGENRADSMANHLKDEIWKQIFESS